MLNRLQKYKEEYTMFMEYIGEFIGTMLLVLLGDGVVANSTLNKTKGQGSGWVAIAIGWGLAVTIGVYASGFLSAGHINPAVTIGFAVIGDFAWAGVPGYIIAQIAGGFVGGVLVWLAYYDHWEATEDSATILGTFATTPEIKHSPANVFSEVIGTAVLVVGVLAMTPNEVATGFSPVVVGITVASIGFSLGGPTGYAINPARDLGPRIAHQVLPVKNKGGSDWGYAWVPVVSPIVGAIIGSVLFNLVLN